MINKRAEITEEHLSLAEQWFTKHARHVRALVCEADGVGYSPSGSDRGRPELWKTAHWIWYLALAKEKAK